MKTYLAAKVHGLRATGKNLEYAGSVTIDRAIMRAARIEPFEKVQVVSLETGSRWETYAVAGKDDSGVFELNGGSARLGETGDRFLVMTYELREKPEPRLVFIGQDNRIEQVLDGNSLVETAQDPKER